MRLDERVPTPFADATDHLREELRWLDRLLGHHVTGLREQGRFNDDPMRGLYIAEAEALAELGAAGAGGIGSEAELARAGLDAREARGPELPLAAIARRFRLDAFERATLLIAAAPAFDRRYQTLYAYAQNDVARRLPTIDLALSLLTGDAVQRFQRLARFAPDAPLMRGELLHWSDADRTKSLCDRALAIDDRVALALLGGNNAVDSRIAAFARVMRDPPGDPDPKLMRACAGAAGASLLLFEGLLDAGQDKVAWALGSGGLLIADLDHPAARALPPAEIGRLLAREALLEASGLFVTAARPWPDQGLEQLLVAAAPVAPGMFAAMRPGAIDLPLVARDVATARVEIAAPAMVDRARWWRDALPAGHEANPDRLAQRTRIGPRTIAELVARCTAGDEDTLLTAIGLHADGQLPAIAQRITVHAGWGDLVVPARLCVQLDELVASLRHWPRVTGDWRFGERLAAAQNCVVLFSGASGTGKTMAAGLIAREAGMPLYRVDLSAIFDKYIGETEKHLDRLFDAAAGAGAVLLFDEADALFGKRTALKDAHDRYANLGVAFLLQRIENYDGLAILTSNLPGNMDEAFARRLAHVMTFPMPDESLRRALWAQAFPEAAPLDPDLDLDAVALAFELSGGNIRNAALAAAYLAAAEDSAIARRHVLGAVARELEKMGRAPIAADYGALGMVG